MTTKARPEAKSKTSPLRSARVVLEACPPAIGDQEKAYAVLKQSFSCYNSFHAVSVPDLQDTGEFQRTRARVSNDEFASWLGRLTEKPLSLYKVCVSCTREEFENWIAEELAEIEACVARLLLDTGTAERDVDRVFMTGGSSFVPAVRRIFETRFGAEKLRGGDELVSVARGLSLCALDLV